MKISSVAILNNPSARLVHILPYRKLDWSSGPRIVLKIESDYATQGAVFKIEAIKGKYLEVRQDLNEGVNYLNFDGCFEEESVPEKLEVMSKEFNGQLLLPIPLKEFQLSGRVLDMNGDPVSGAWVVILDSVFYNIAISDSEGAYAMRLPAGAYDSIAAFDSRYPAERLEDYYWNLTLDNDKKVDFRIGNAEVFRLMVSGMRQNKILSGSFIAYASEMIRAFLEKEKPADMDHPGFMSSENTPNLSCEDVQILLNGCVLKGPLLLERADILSPGGRINKLLGYKFEISYASYPVELKDNELEVRIQKTTVDGRARIGSLSFL